MQPIFRTIAGILLGLFLMGIGTYINKKFRIMERKIFFKVFFLFLFGLLLLIESPIFFASDLSTGSLSLLKGILYVAIFLIGAVLLGLLVRILVVDNQASPTANTASAQVFQENQSPDTETAELQVYKNRLWGWVMTIGGLLLTATCVYLFWAYGPQRDAPGMTAEHQQIDVVINYICASVAIIGLVLFGAGIRKLRRIRYSSTIT